MNFNNDTYIVLDLPSPINEEVLNIRKKLSFYYETIPAEITITGSSGVGLISPDQDKDQFIAILENIVDIAEPIRSSFKRINRFPNSGVYFLEPTEQDDFKELHDKFANSQITFTNCPFPYYAHCTIKNDHQNEIVEPETILSMDCGPKRVLF